MAHVETAFARSRKPERGLRERPSAACRAEALDLLATAETLTAANAKLGATLDEWRQRVNDLLAGPIADDLATERQLEELAMDFRRQWIDLAHSVVAGEMRSPPLDRLPLLPVSPSVHHLYERILGPRAAQDKLKAVEPDVPGWKMEISLFDSGMAAITAAITVLRHKREKYCRVDGHALELDMFGGYFETLILLELLNSSDLRCQTFRNLERVLDRFSRGETDVLFLELIAYDWKQTVIDPARLLEALAARPTDRPWVLMVDSTLLGPMFQLGPLLVACGARTPLLAMDIRSGLKLEQVGLEFSNVGIIKTLSPEGLDTDRYMDAEQFHESLVSARKRLGGGLSLSQVAILDAPWIFHPEWTLRHTQAVLDNNRRLAFALSGVRGLFAHVNHPCLSPQCELTWAESPIVVMEFHAGDDGKANAQFLLAVIAREVRRRRLVFHLGASFGFRHHRCEMVEPYGYAHPDGKAATFLKVAMGSRSGPGLDATIELMQELAGFPDFDALRFAYPEVKPDRELAVFPDLQSLRLIR